MLVSMESFAEASELGVAALDAPVSGGDIGAREARLSIMVGGDLSASAAVKPILTRFGTNIVHLGKAGHWPALQNGQPDRHCLQPDGGL